MPRPGFEPGSLPRKGKMIDRATPSGHMTIKNYSLYNSFGFYKYLQNLYKLKRYINN